MKLYEAWIRLPDLRTTHVRFHASDWHSAQALAEAQYGQGNVINITMISE